MEILIYCDCAVNEFIFNVILGEMWWQMILCIGKYSIWWKNQSIQFSLFLVYWLLWICFYFSNSISFSIIISSLFVYTNIPFIPLVLMENWISHHVDGNFILMLLTLSDNHYFDFYVMNKKNNMKKKKKKEIIYDKARRTKLHINKNKTLTEPW